MIQKLSLSNIFTANRLGDDFSIIFREFLQEYADFKRRYKKQSRVLLMVTCLRVRLLSWLTFGKNYSIELTKSGQHTVARGAPIQIAVQTKPNQN